MTHANTPPLSRNAIIAIGVVVFHVGAIWALQSGLLRRAIEVIVPVQILSELIEPPAPKVTPPPPAPPVPVNQPLVKPKAPTTPPPPELMAVPDLTPSPNAPMGVTTPQPPAPPIAAPTAVVQAPSPPPAPPAPPKVELPSSDADYLQNPKPVYPSISKRLGEQGQVVHTVLIGADGLPVSAKLVKSSGFDRLDLAAYKAIMGWRYTPGKRNGVATAMSYNAPISFVLE